MLLWGNWGKNIDSRGKAILITGCDTGFGHRLAVRLNSRGFRVYATVLDQNGSGAHELLEKCHFKDIMTIIQMDVTNEQEINDCFNRVKNELEANGEQLWALVNNAGVITYGLLEWGSFQEYKKLFDVNVFGLVKVTRTFIPLLRPTKGRIVMMASLGGRVTADLLGAYCMTKSSIISFSDALRREMKKFGVRVITIEPAVFKTQMFYSFQDSIENNWKNTDPTVRQLYGETYPNSYIEKHKKGPKKSFSRRAGDDIEIVVNDMIKAIISPKPNRSYRPVSGTINRIAAKFIEFVPQVLIDKHFNRVYNTIPQCMADKNDTK